MSFDGIEIDTVEAGSIESPVSGGLGNYFTAEASNVADSSSFDTQKGTFEVAGPTNLQLFKHSMQGAQQPGTPGFGAGKNG